MTEEPDSNAMILEQAEGATEVVLKLLEQLKPANSKQQDDKRGCIWTLKGWKDNNLKWLKANINER